MIKQMLKLRLCYKPKPKSFELKDSTLIFDPLYYRNLDANKQLKEVEALIKLLKEIEINHIEVSTYFRYSILAGASLKNDMKKIIHVIKTGKYKGVRYKRLKLGKIVILISPKIETVCIIC